MEHNVPAARQHQLPYTHLMSAQVQSLMCPGNSETLTQTYHIHFCAPHPRLHCPSASTTTKLTNYAHVWGNEKSGTVVLSAPSGFIFSFVISREARPAWCAPKPPQTPHPARQAASRPGTPLSDSPAAVLTSLAGGQMLRAVGRTSTKTHSPGGKSVRGPPLDTGWTREATGETWKQPSVERGKIVFRPAEQRRLRGLKVRHLPLV